jgi:Spy/CpxP family protein refolding chaperone
MFADAVKMTDQDGNTVTSPDGAKIRSFRISVDGEKMKEMQSKMQERQARLQEDQERAEKEIELVLTPAQRPPINSFLRDLELFRGALLPPELIKELDLNGPQKRKLQNIVMKAKNDREQRVQGAMAQARQSGQYTSLGSSIGSSYTDWQKEVREKSRAVLTTEQRAILEKWEKERPASSYGLPSGGPVVRLGG